MVKISFVSLVLTLLQVLVAEKESKIAEMEADSTGKAARFRAAVENVKGEIAHLKHEHVCVNFLEYALLI